MYTAMGDDQEAMDTYHNIRGGIHNFRVCAAIWSNINFGATGYHHPRK
jgi:hypothetical protein